MNIELVDIYTTAVDGPTRVHPYVLSTLYSLLEERPPEANISHNNMPSWKAHVRFVESKPYQAWYMIIRPTGSAASFVAHLGCIYLTRRREVGISVLRGLQGQGIGTAALARLRELHPGRMLANVAPTNIRSINFFVNRGAKQIQQTYELP